MAGGCPRWNAGELTRNESRRLPPQPLSTRRSPLSQSSTLLIGRDGHNATMAVASGAQAHGAAVPALGPLGTRQGARDHLRRTMPSQATHLRVVSEAGPGGDWR